MPPFSTLPAITCLSLLLVSVPVSAGDDLPTLITRLTDPDVDVRFDALFALRDIERPAPNVAMALKDALTDEDFGIRIAAAEAFLHVAGDADAVEPLLADPDEYVQREIARLLVGDGRRLEPSVHWLLAHAEHALSTGVQEIFEACSQERGRQVIPILLRALESATTSAEFSAARKAVSGIDGLSAGHVPQLMRLLQHEDAARRACAAELLGMMGDEAAASLPALEACLNDSRQNVRVRAALTLLSFPSRREHAIAGLRLALHDEHAPSRFDAVHGLEWLESPPHELAPELVKVLGSEDEFERAAAARLMTTIGPDVVPLLVTELGAPDVHPPSAQCWCSIGGILQQFGPEAAASIPALLQVTRSEDIAVQAEAVRAIGSVCRGNHAAVARLAGMTPHASAEIRRAVADALVGAAGADEKLRATARTALWSMFQDDIPQVRISTAANLIVLGEEPSRCLPVLESFLIAEDGKIVEASLDAFETIGPGAAPSIPALIAAFKTGACVPAGISSSPLHEIMPNVIAKVGTAAVPALIVALDDADPQVRGHAAEALGLIGPEAAGSAAALAGRFRDRGQYVKTMGCMAYVQTVAQDALQAVARIGPQAKGALPGLADLIRRQPVDTIEKADLQSAIIDALGAIGPDAADAVPWLWDVATQDDDAWWNAHALVALARITPDDRRVFEQFNELLLWIPQWAPMLESHGADASLVVDFLRNRGPQARTLIPTLSHLLCEAPLLSRDFRIRIAITIAHIDPNNDDAIRYLQRQALIGPRGYRPPIHQWYARRILRQLAEGGLFSQATYD